jgi:hypothetical protein
LRRYEKPFNLSGRELIKKFCLSMGLLQPGDSRDIIVDILYVLLKAKNDQKELSSEEIKDLVIEFRKNQNLALLGVASSNIRRQIKRLRDVFIAEKVKNNYRITEFASIAELFDEKTKKIVLPSVLDRVLEYAKKVDEEFK